MVESRIGLGVWRPGSGRHSLNRLPFGQWSLRPLLSIV